MPENALFDPLLVPFDHRTMKPKDVGLGGPSTEYLATVFDSEGRPVNIPLIWWTPSGQPVLMNEQNALSFFNDYESKANALAPRYSTIGQAVEFAMHRSALGGASRRPLFKVGGGQ